MSNDTKNPNGHSQRPARPRGAVELVIAGIALKAGLFSAAVSDAPVVKNLFSAVVIMAVVTTVVSPIILKRAFSSEEN